MALENVFGSPPPVVGLNKDHTMNKHGEKQRNGLLDDPSDGEKEEGEIEDGEIIDSQEDEDDGGGGGIARGASAIKVFAAKSRIEDAVQKSSNRGTVQVADGGTSSGNKKTKKKKKKKKKRPLGQLLEDELGSAVSSMEDAGLNDQKSKKQRKFYVDHDQINEDDGYFRSNSPSFQRGCRGTNSTSPSHGYDSPPYRRSTPPTQPSRRSRSPPGLYDSPYESDEECDGSGAPLSGTNGRYDDGPMGGEQFASGRMGLNGTGKNRRKTRRGENGRQGAGRKKRKQRPPVAICKFYQDGKCSKGDDCMFKHDGSVPKKPDLCKFYLNGFCAKGEGCLYLHNEYPCKFFHTGVKCYSADNCRFSHDPLTDDTRILLEKCLDKEEDEMTADVPQKHFRPSLLGTPPNRFSKDGPVHEALKGIPSLFDIEVSMPASLQQQQQQNMSSPSHQQQQNMSPPSHQQQKQQEDHQVGSSAHFFYAETMNGSSGIQTKTPLLPLPFCGNRSQRGISFDGEENDMYQPGMGMMDVDDRIGGLDCTTYMSNGESMDTDLRTMLPQNCPSDGDGSMFHSRPWHITAVDVDMRGRRMDNNGEDWEGRKGQQSDQERDRSSDSESEGGAKKTDSTRPIQVPVHLPKKQRELFLRIQQQQRKAGGGNQQDSEKDAKRKMDGEDEEETKEGDVTEEMDNDEEEDTITKFNVGEVEDGGGGGDENEEEEEEEKEEEEEDAFQEAVGIEQKREREEAEMDEQEKERWYSSDDDDEDEDQPLTAVLKKLQQQPIQKMEPQKPAPPFSTTSIFDIAKMIQSITNQSSPATTLTASKNTVEVSTNPRSQSTKAANLSRDPRSQKQVAESRDPRAARNIETHEHIHKSFFRDPRMLQSTASIHKDGKSSSSLLNAKKEQKSTVLSSPDITDSENPNSIPYRVHTIVTSQPDYAHVASTIHMDPKLMVADPRLKRHLADDPRFARYVVGSPHSSDEVDQRKKVTEASFRDFAGTKVKRGGIKPITSARPGVHRLGVVTMPGPLRDESLPKGSGGSTLVSRKGEDEEFSLFDLDEIVKKPSAFPRRLSRDGSIEAIRSPVREAVAKELLISKRTLCKVDESDTSRESSTPPFVEQKVQEPAKMKGGSYKRKSSMDYASPLGGGDVVEHSDGYGGYNKRPKLVQPVVARNKPNESPVSIPKDLLEPPRSSSTPIGLSSLPTPADSDEVLVIDNASLKDIFKTIDPTASPFC